MVSIKRKKGTIGILTGGGDVPGLNPAIRAVTIRAIREGFKVIGLSRSAEKSHKLIAMGAAAVFAPQDRSWTRSLKQAIAPQRVALAIDNIGGRLLPHVIDTLGDQGKVSLVGRLAGPVPEFNTATLFFRRIRLGGVAVGAYTPQESRSAWSEVVRLLATTGAKPIVDSVFPFTEVREAFARLARGPLGKVLLRVNDTEG